MQKSSNNLFSFKASLDIIGINPFVFVPNEILNSIFVKAGKDRGPIPVCGEVNGKAFQQNLMKFKGEWRLYINMIMLPNSPKRIGEIIDISIDHDPISRQEQPHPAFEEALNNNPEQKTVFENLAPSRQKEIVRYINRIKSEEIRTKNIEKAIAFLAGKERFVGRDKP